MKVGQTGMDQTTLLREANRDADTMNLIEFITTSIDAGKVAHKPFYHVELENIFPANLYAEMLKAMPDTSDYRPMRCLCAGIRSKCKIRPIVC
jgi:hypothetical protein